MAKKQTSVAAPEPILEPADPLTAETIELGRWVKDRVSGFEGVAVGINIHLNDMVQISIQPPVQPNAVTLPDSLGFDIQNIVYGTPPEGWEQPVWTQPTKEWFDLGFDLGNKVKDIVTKDEGIVTQFAIMINGCLYVVFDMQKNDKNKSILPKNHHFVDWTRIEYVDDGITKKLQKKMGEVFENSPDATRGPGGPVTKSFRPGQR